MSCFDYTCEQCGAWIDYRENRDEEVCPNGCAPISESFECDCGEWFPKTKAVAISHKGELLATCCADEHGFCEYNHAEYVASLSEEPEPDALDRVYAAFKDIRS